MDKTVLPQRKHQRPIHFQETQYQSLGRIFLLAESSVAPVSFGNLYHLRWIFLTLRNRRMSLRSKNLVLERY